MGSVSSTVPFHPGSSGSLCRVGKSDLPQLECDEGVCADICKTHFVNNWCLFLPDGSSVP
jgi:hypothetical protein